MNVALEVRPRLAQATFHLSFADNKFDSELDVSYENNVISGKQSRDLREVFSFIWPQEVPQPVQIHPLAKDGAKRFSYKVQLSSNGTPCLLQPQINKGISERSWDSFYKWPKCVLPVNLSETGNVKVLCTKCYSQLGKDDLKFQRCLPLPSLMWRESSSDWFCGCGISTSSSANGQTNRDLYKHSLSPKEDSIHFGPGFIQISPKTLNPSRILSCNADAELRCQFCHHVIGEQDREKVTLWQFSVLVTSATNSSSQNSKISLEDTFCDLVNGLVCETPGKSKKLFLTCKDKTLCVWFLEQDIDVYKSISSKWQMNNLEKASVNKVLFTDTSSLIKSNEDIHLQVPEELIDSGIKMLKREMLEEIPGMFQCSFFPKWS